MTCLLNLVCEVLEFQTNYSEILWCLPEQHSSFGTYMACHSWMNLSIHLACWHTQEALLLQRNRATRYVNWNIMAFFWPSYWQEALLMYRNHASTCQLKSCKMPHKCSMDCIWKRLQAVNDLQSHSRSLPLLPFDTGHNTYLPKLRCHVTLISPTWRQFIIITRL